MKARAQLIAQSIVCHVPDLDSIRNQEIGEIIDEWGGETGRVLEDAHRIGQILVWNN